MFLPISMRDFEIASIQWKLMRMNRYSDAVDSVFTLFPQTALKSFFNGGMALNTQFTVEKTSYLLGIEHQDQPIGRRRRQGGTKEHKGAEEQKGTKEQKDTKEQGPSKNKFRRLLHRFNQSMALNAV